MVAERLENKSIERSHDGNEVSAAKAELQKEILDITGTLRDIEKILSSTKSKGTDAEKVLYFVDKIGGPNLTIFGQFGHIRKAFKEVHDLVKDGKSKSEKELTASLETHSRALEAIYKAKDDNWWISLVAEESDASAAERVNQITEYEGIIDQLTAWGKDQKKMV